MEPVIKVCGIRNIEEALGAVDAGANTIGMLTGLLYPAEDEISPEKAGSIAAALPDGIRPVLVTHILDPEEASEIAAFTGVSAVQIHNDMPADGLIRLRGLLPGVLIIKAIHVVDSDSITDARLYEKYADMLLLDTKTNDGIGGTGITHDWSISKRIVEAVHKPVILAGGLNPDNIEEAVALVRPAGIDANSGLENENGSKNFNKIRAFAVAGRFCSVERY